MCMNKTELSTYLVNPIISVAFLGGVVGMLAAFTITHHPQGLSTPPILCLRTLFTDCFIAILGQCSENIKQCIDKIFQISTIL